MIKLKDLLFEQKTEQFIIQPFKQTFLPNYVTPTDSWKSEFAPVMQKIKALKDAGWSLDQLQITIESGASKASATNRYSSTNPPYHNFEKMGQRTGGLLPNPPGSWVPDPNFKRTPSTTPSDTTYQKIPKGNDFLAKMRGEQLRKVLLPYLKSQLGQNIPAEFIIIQPKLNSEKFVRVALNSKLSQKPAPTKLPPAGTYVLGQGTRELGIDTTKIWPNLPSNKQYDIWRKNPVTAEEQYKRFGVRLLPKDNTADLGAGPGKPIILTKALANLLFKRGDEPLTRVRGFLNNMGGDWIDYEIEMWIRDKKANRDVASRNWKYVDSATGLPKPGVYSNYEYGMPALTSPIGGIDYNTLIS